MRQLRKTGRSSSNGLALLRAFVENPKQVASILPSSSALRDELAGLNCLCKAHCVVELGPGTGETTQALLVAMPPSARLLSIELVPELVEQVRQIDDPRLIVEHANALDVVSILNRHQLPAPDVVVSGIPFSHLSPQEGQQLVDQIFSALTPGGTFVAYQFRDHIRKLADDRFGPPETSFIPWNIPPLDIYQWTKATAASA